MILFMRWITASINKNAQGSKNSLFQTDAFQQFLTKFLTKLRLIDNQLTTAKTFAFVTYAEQMVCLKHADVCEEDSLYIIL